MQVPPHIRQLSAQQLYDYVCHRSGVEPTPMEQFLIAKIEELMPQEDRIEALLEEKEQVVYELEQVKHELKELQINYEAQRLELKVLESATSPQPR